VTLCLWIRIRTSSSNIIDELEEDENIRASSAAELVNSKKSTERYFKKSGGRKIEAGENHDCKDNES